MVSDPFFLLAPEWALLPLVMLTGIATVIASQAVITGAFSLTQQAVQLGLLPASRSSTPPKHNSGRSISRRSTVSPSRGCGLAGADLQDLILARLGLWHCGDGRDARGYGPVLHRRAESLALKMWQVLGLGIPFLMVISSSSAQTA